MSGIGFGGEGLLPGANEAFTAISRLNVEPRVGELSVGHTIADGEDVGLGDPTIDNTITDLI